VRKYLIAAAVTTMAASGAFTLPAAHATGECGTGPDLGTLGSTSGTIRVGVSGLGCLTGAGSATDATGFVIADGAGSNPGQSAGYIGVVRGADGTVYVIGFVSGDASESNGGLGSNAPGDHTNNVILSSNGTVGNPTC